MILHFGMPKTGSTSIQSSLYHRLVDPDSAYIHFGTPNSSAMLVTGFKRNPKTFHRHRLGGTSGVELGRLKERALATLEAELRRVGDRTAVLSAEALCSFSERDLDGLCVEIQRHGKRRIRAVGYVRRPREFMGSSFQQRLKSDLAQLDLNALYPHYRRKLEKFDTLLGQGNVQLWLFEPRRFVGGCVVQDFCNRLGIAFKGSRVRRVNEALSLPAVSLLYAYRKFGPGFGFGVEAFRENELLVRELQKIEGPKFHFHPSLVEPVLASQKGDIRWVEERVGESLRDESPADDEWAVRSEDDLLRHSVEAGVGLARRMGRSDLSVGELELDPQRVAALVHELRKMLAVKAGPA